MIAWYYNRKRKPSDGGDDPLLDVCNKSWQCSRQDFFYLRPAALFFKTESVGMSERATGESLLPFLFGVTLISSSPRLSDTNNESFSCKATRRNPICANQTEHFLPLNVLDSTPEELLPQIRANLDFELLPLVFSACGR